MGRGSPKSAEAGEYQASEASQGDRGLAYWVSNGSSETQHRIRISSADGCLTEFPQCNLDVFSHDLRGSVASERERSAAGP